MVETTKVTSKRQITIPVKLFKELGLKEGDELILRIENNQIILQKAQDQLDSIAGSLPLPSKYQGIPLEMIIREAKSEYFTSKTKK